MELAINRILSEFKQIQNDPNYYYSVSMDNNNIYKWNFVMLGPPGTIYEGGIFNGEILFPKSYPHNAPKIRFIFPIIHPNIYKDGRMCISILHDGDDEFNYEHISERWKPTHSIDSVLISILSVLGEPNFESPANVDASIQWQKNFNEYKKIIYRQVSETQN